MRGGMLRLLPVLIGLAISLPLLGAATDDAALMKQVGAIPLDGVEGRFDHFGADVEGKRLYVAALGNNTLEAIDLATNQRSGTIRGLKKPTGIRVVPGSGKIVVASGDDGKARVFDRKLELLGTIDRLDDADNVRLDGDGKLAYVGYGDGGIAIIDPQQIKKLGEVKLEGHPESFQLETRGPRIFVNVPSAKQVAVIDREKRAVVAKWSVRDAADNFSMALDESNRCLFIGCRKPAKMLVLDTETGHTVTSIDCCGDTDDLFYDPAAKRIFLTGGAGCISVIAQDDADRYRLLGNVPTAAGARTSLYMPELGLLYVAVPHREKQRAELRVFSPAGRN
jgi:YVTN family beta-propeller protein